MDESAFKPIIGITMGDPASIGPELILKVFRETSLYEECRPLVIGDAGILEKTKKIIRDNGNPEIHSIREVKSALFEKGVIDVIDLEFVEPDEIETGIVSARAGDASFHYVKKVIELALAKEIDATVTNAINKEAINLAGHHYAGHTEIYADLTHSQNVSMMLVHKNLRVVHVSTHVSLRQACNLVRKERVLSVIKLANQTCCDMGIREPKIGVAGLNPHSGEGGLFGNEEIKEISPAIKDALNEGIDVRGPVPPDTIFSKAKGGVYDIVVAMYHDQGHIPLKLSGFHFDPVNENNEEVEGVNITLGLPIIRTSVDHGTAFDLAGKGTACPDSLKSAIDYAVNFAQNHG